MMSLRLRSNAAKWIAAAVLAILLVFLAWVAVIVLIAGREIRSRSQASAVRPVGNAKKAPDRVVPPAARIDPATTRVARTSVRLSRVKYLGTILGNLGAYGEITNVGTRDIQRVDLRIYAMDARGVPVWERVCCILATRPDHWDGDRRVPLRPGYSQTWGYEMKGLPVEAFKGRDYRIIVDRVEFVQ